MENDLMPKYMHLLHSAARIVATNKAAILHSGLRHRNDPFHMRSSTSLLYAQNPQRVVLPENIDVHRLFSIMKFNNTHYNELQSSGFMPITQTSSSYIKQC